MINALNNVQCPRCARPYPLHLSATVYAMHQCRWRKKDGIRGSVEKVHYDGCKTVVIEKRRGKGWVVRGCEVFEEVCDCDGRGCCC
jgi:hypothetical protein